MASASVQMNDKEREALETALAAFEASVGDDKDAAKVARVARSFADRYDKAMRRRTKREKEDV